MQTLTVYVEQGELIGIRHRGEAVIVDSRWPDEHEKAIEKQLRVFLHNQVLAGLVLTGFDNDHADPYGVDNILGKYKPNWIMYPKYYKDTENATEVFKVIRKHERRRRKTATPLRMLSVRVDLHSRILNGLSKFFSYELFSPHYEDMDNSNNCSIVLKLTGAGAGGFAYLITGDTENERWETITRLFRKSLSSDVLSAPHHGSKNAAHPKMTLLVDPDTVLISAGVGNQYGHPDAKAVKLYSKVARQVFQTNIEDGVSLLTTRRGGEFVTRCVR